MKRVRMTLTMTVEYSKEDESAFTEEELRQLYSNLDYLPQHAAGIGALTDDAFDAVVDTWSSDVTQPKEITE